MRDHLPWLPIRIAIGCALWMCILVACRSGTAGLSHPTGVAVAADGSLYVMDHATRNRSRVVHITAEGKIINTFQPNNPKPGLVYSG